MLNLNEMKSEAKANKAASHIYLNSVDSSGRVSDDPEASENFTRADFFKMLRKSKDTMIDYNYETVLVCNSLFIKCRALDLDEIMKREKANK